MQCLTDNTLVAWFDRELTPETRDEIEAHVEQCEDCRALVIEVARVSSAPEEVSPGTRAPLRVGAPMGRYVVLEWLGAGGMGVVYSAYDPELDRRVAIKVLHSDTASGAPTQEALLREAQALARVSHPNVLTIYDVGTHQGETFISMEHVSGSTLADWLRAETRPWRAILSRFLDAARGLGAAHAAGLIHGDFKPSNVLVGEDGRVRVTDFGLAHVVAREGLSAGASGADAARSWEGTPAYMSPEQKRGEPLDPRSDQYSFCVALGEALRATGGASVPVSPSARVRSALAKGLSESPADRFPSMGALVLALDRRRMPIARQVGIVVLALAVGAFGATAYVRSAGQAPGVCSGASQSLRGIWDDDTKRRVSSAFEGTHALYASDALTEVERLLDRYTASWATTYDDACAATRVRREQSEGLYELRAACLDAEKQELVALSNALGSADAKTVETSVQAVHALPAVAACSDAAALRGRRTPPPDPAALATINHIRAAIDDAMATARSGHDGSANSAMGPLVDAAKATKFAPLEAAADVDLGVIRANLGDVAGADALFTDALDASERGMDDLQKARALVELTLNLADRESKYDEAARMGRLAGVVLSRLPSEVELYASLLVNISAVSAGRGRYAEAFENTEKARELRERLFGPEDFVVAMSLNASANQLSNMGDVDKALAYQERALAIFERVVGDHHPRVAIVLYNIAGSERMLHRFDDALRAVDRGRTIWQQTFGEDHPQITRFDGMRGEILLDANHPLEARIAAEKALKAAERLESQGLDLVEHLDLLAAADIRLARFDEALATLTRARALCATLSDPVLETATTLHLIGSAQLEMGHAERAIESLESALALRTKASLSPTDMAETLVFLARALWDSSTDRARAVGLATRARDAYAARPDCAKERADADRWLATHTSR